MERMRGRRREKGWRKRIQGEGGGKDEERGGKEIDPQSSSLVAWLTA